MTNELYLKRDDVLNLFEEYQPKLATHVSEFGDALEDLKFRALKSQPCEDAISREEVLKHRHVVQNNDWIGCCVVRVDEITKLPSVTPKQPFINKPCISEGVCREDKVTVLDKIRAEIETLEDGITSYYNDRPWIFKDEVLQIIDKYIERSEE